MWCVCERERERERERDSPIAGEGKEDEVQSVGKVPEAPVTKQEHKDLHDNS